MLSIDRLRRMHAIPAIEREIEQVLCPRESQRESEGENLFVCTCKAQNEMILHLCTSSDDR